MKLGIRKIRYVPASQVQDYSQLPAGSTFDFAAFRNAALQELPFTMDTADFSENWRYDDNGRYSEVVVSAIPAGSAAADRKEGHLRGGTRFRDQIRGRIPGIPSDLHLFRRNFRNFFQWILYPDREQKPSRRPPDPVKVSQILPGARFTFASVKQTRLCSYQIWPWIFVAPG